MKIHDPATQLPISYFQSQILKSRTANLLNKYLPVLSSQTLNKDFALLVLKSQIKNLKSQITSSPIQKYHFHLRISAN